MIFIIVIIIYFHILFSIKIILTLFAKIFYILKTYQLLLTDTTNYLSIQRHFISTLYMKLNLALIHSSIVTLCERANNYK